jgi:hypothetical protein
MSVAAGYLAETAIEEQQYLIARKKNDIQTFVRIKNPTQIKEKIYFIYVL